MKLNLRWVYDTLFPLTDDEKLISAATPAQFKTKLQPVAVTHTISALASFKDAEVRAALHLVKFHNHIKATALLSELLASYLSTLPHDQYLLLPVPLSSKRYRERGYNQVAVIASHAVTHLPHFQLRTNLLRKVRHTRPQTTLSKEERIRNLNGAFLLPKTHRAACAQKHIILLDDVTTTGSTLTHAKAACADAHAASITLLALAH